MTDVDDNILNESLENDDTFSNTVNDRDEEQDLIVKSNTIDEEVPGQKYLNVLQRSFAHSSFRPLQWKIISSIINDRRDNCAIMATGYGKSLCFQYPSVCTGGVTIVVSPLISLMEDQVLSMQMSNISACLLGTAQSNKQKVVEDIIKNKYSLIYFTPELCCGNYGQNLLKRMKQKLNIVLIAIDEAHCVSSWGHDFRYQYRELGKIRDVLPKVPILAVTATATPKVRTDIISCLRLRNPQVLCSGFDRPNIQFSVYLKGSTGVLPDLKKVMTEKNADWSFPGSTIIYCITRKQTDQIATSLQVEGIQCLPYHAGMTLEARKEAHEKFTKDKVKIIVATIAFGMGIDKPDVRNIIHYGASKDVESYYQEVGRAGRDGQPSNCTIFYNSGDFDMHQIIRELDGTLNETTRNRREAMERIMVQYLETWDCRRQFILNHFEGPVIPKGPKLRCCDNCTRNLQQNVSYCNEYEGLNEQGFYDFTGNAHTYLAAVQAMNGKFGTAMYVQFLRGLNSSKLYNYLQNHPLNGSGQEKSTEWWRAVARLVEREGYLKKTVHKNGSSVSSTYSLSDKAEKFLQKKGVGSNKIMLQPPPEILELLKYKQPISPEETSRGRNRTDSKNDTHNQSERNESDVEEEWIEIYRQLRNKRSDLASAVDCMPYMVASNEALMKIAEMKPRTVKELRNCQLEGFTEAKISRFGEELVKTVRIICPLDPIESHLQNKRSIQDILAKNALPGARITITTEVSYSMYKSGLSAEEIATKRRIRPSRVFSHLADAIKAGYPIKLIDLKVTDEMRDLIINIIRNPPINSDMSRLKIIKNECPADVSYDAIKVVVAYLQVRNHLSTLGFELPVQNTAQLQNQQSSLTIASQSNHNINRLLDFATEDCTSGSSQSTSTHSKKIELDSLVSFKNCQKREADIDSVDSIVLESSSINTPMKKPKLDDSVSRKSECSDDLVFLDSPPQKMENKELTHTISSQKPKDIGLEKTLDDDFFDDALLDDVDKVILSSSPSTSNKLNAAEVELKNQEKQFTHQSSTTCDLSKQKKLNDHFNERDSAVTQKSKLKMFKFKSKVSQSVMESAEKLCSQQPTEHLTK